MSSTYIKASSEFTRDINFSGRKASTNRTKSNQVSLQHYKLHLFLSRILLHHLSRPITIWLALLSILQLSLDITYNEFLYMTLLPLLLILILSLLTEAVYTYQKYLNDIKVNNAPSKIWDGNTFTEVSTADIMVGDFVLLYTKELVPADMILLCTANSDSKCFVDCSGILDEKDLLTKFSVESIRHQLSSDNLDEVPFKLKRIKGNATLPLPSSDFSNFEGKIRLKASPVASLVRMKNLLLRDSKIMNTAWVIGLVVYTGSDTKAWIASTSIPRKQSSIESLLKKLTLALCTAVVVFAAISLILTETVAETRSFSSSGQSFFYFLLLYSVLVPVPLYFVLEVIKIIRVRRIQNECGVSFRNSNILEDLGRVEYILADKSGTLTDKETNAAMILFKNCYFKNIEDFAEKEISPTDINRRDSSTCDKDTLLLSYKSVQNEKEHFIRCMAVCNKGYTTDYGESYQTKSETDRILIQNATILGQKLVKRTEKSLTILKSDEEHQFSILGYQSKSKQRAKCHIILQSVSDKTKLFLYIIGSLEAMDPVVRFRETQDPSTLDIVKANNQSGYRQLILAYKEIARQDAESFVEAFKQAKRSPVNRGGRVESLFEEIEKNSVYLGLISLEESVDVETKLAVTHLKHAGIKFWMLSGDDFEGSLSAGLSSGIVEDTIPLVSIHNIKTEDEFQQVTETLIENSITVNQSRRRTIVRRSSLSVFNEPLAYLNSEKGVTIQGHTNTFMNVFSGNFTGLNTRQRMNTEEFGQRGSEQFSSQHNDSLQRGQNIHPLVSKITNIKSRSLSNVKMQIRKDFCKYTLFIDSTSLEFGLKNEENLKNLVILMYCANSICFTSMLPSHKTKIAKMLRDNFEGQPFFLAVGDGGSDVGMIKEACIGVGVHNIEGYQAASASDIMISEFSDLKSLILQHGFLARYSIKKSLVLATYSISLQFTLVALLGLISDYSGSIFMPVEWYFTYYLIFSVNGIVFIGVFDNEESLAMLENNLKLYMCEKEDSGLAVKLVLSVALGVYQSGCAIFTFNYGYSGVYESILNESSLLFISTIITMNATYGIMIRNLNGFTVLGLILSVTFAMIMIIIQSFDSNSDVYGALQIFSKSPAQIICICMLILVQILPVLFFTCWQQLFFARPFDFLRAQGTAVFSMLSQKLLKYSDDLSKIFKATNVDFKQNLCESGVFSKFKLRFVSKIRDFDYQISMISERKNQFNVFSSFLILYLLIYLITNIASKSLEFTNLILEIIWILILALIFLFQRIASDNHLKIIFHYYYILLSISMIIVIELATDVPYSVFIIFPSFYFIFINDDWLLMLLCNLSVTACLFAAASSSISLLPFIAIYSASAINCGIIAYHLKLKNLAQYNLNHKVQEEYDKVTGVLDYLLPTFVKKKVKDGVRYIAEDQGEVTVLFCYIVGFEKIIKDYNIPELTTLLDELFWKIDGLCELSGVSKIETVANTYMACAGLKDSDSEMKPYFQTIPHAKRAIELGFAILRASQQIFLKSGERLPLKIGINSGRVTAGVVGFHKPQFSLIGDTVNTASRMASTADKNTIQISKSTYDAVGDAKNFHYKMNRVEIKGKGTMETFTITLEQMKSRENFIENRMSVSYSSVASMAAQSFALADSSVSEESQQGFLQDLQLLKTSDYFKENEGVPNIRWFSLCRDELQQEKLFKDLLRDNYFWVNLSGVAVEVVCSILMIVTIGASEKTGEYFKYLIAAGGIEISLLVVAAWMIVRFKYKYSTYIYSTGIYVFGFLVSVIAYIEFPGSEIIFMQVLLHFQLLSCCSGLFFSQIFWLEVVCALLWFAVLISQDYHRQDFKYFILASVCFIAAHAYLMHSREKKMRINSNLASIANKELDTTEKLLKQMIPEHVYKHLKEENSVTDIFYQVTIIYADIVGFTPWSSGRDSVEIVNMLSMLFTRFDESSVAHKVYKVHTIGDCYVAIGFLGSDNRNPVAECGNIIRFAYSMLAIIEEVKEKHKELNMRIGVHTGDIIGGVMGTSIVRYDIYGPDVLIANQMESSGIPGQIVISETTKQFLELAQPNMFNYEFHTKVTVTERECNAYRLLKANI